MKKLTYFFAVLLLMAFSTAGSAQTVSVHGQLSVSGVHLMDQNGEPLMLQGVSYGWHNWWPRFYNEESVKSFAEDWNCTVVRAAMGVEPEKGYKDDRKGSLRCVEAVIKGAIENDIYVIIDWHSHGIETDAAVEFFTNMAKKYGDYPNIIYEIFNEPVHDSWQAVKEYSIEVIQAIREYDQDNVILVGSPHWDQDLHIVADDPITGFDNLMYTLHFYAATHGQFLRDRGNYAMEKGLALFVSESAGMEASGNGPIDYDAWAIWIDWMKEHQISWVSWSIADKDETCSMMKTNASSKGPWSDDELKESGIKTRELFRQIK